MKMSQREMILGVATLAAVLMGGTWYLIDSKMEHWKDMAAQIENLKQQTRLHENAIQKQGDWLGDLNELQDHLPVFAPDQQSVAPELVKTIKQVASPHGLLILKSNPYKEKTTGDLFELGINCSWEGSLEALVGFLTDLQQQGVRYDPRTLNVTPIGKNTGKLKGNIVIHCAFTRRTAAP